MKTCTVEGCERAHLARGYCSSHYNRWRRHGDPLAGRVENDPRPIDVRIAEMVTATDPAECWIWKGVIGSSGHGQLIVDGVMQLAHRLAYQLAHGEIPAGHQVHHECQRRRCVNPLHLTAMTPAQHSAAHVALRRTAA